MRYVLIKRAAELTGYSVPAIEAKISKSQWREGELYVKAPDGRIFIDLVALEDWIVGATPKSKPRRRNKSGYEGPFL